MNQNKKKPTSKSQLVRFNIGFRWDRWDSLVGQYRITMEFLTPGELGMPVEKAMQLFALKHGAMLVVACQDAPAILSRNECSTAVVGEEPE